LRREIFREDGLLIYGSGEKFISAFTARFWQRGRGEYALRFADQIPK
jgi:hypothetical protein